VEQRRGDATGCTWLALSGLEPRETAQGTHGTGGPAAAGGEADRSVSIRSTIAGRPAMTLRCHRPAAWKAARTAGTDRSTSVSARSTSPDARGAIGTSVSGRTIIRGARLHAMPLTPGTHIGPYEILALIGQGGMGEVYRARDTRLKRSVALKILPASFADDPVRIGRFRREAELLASLNHPNIAAIYGLEEEGGPPAIALELVEGDSLAHRIAHGPLAVDDVMSMARQTAAALSAAHDRGVIHRDLKPSNISIRPDGTVKVLDFGLAKALDPSADASGAEATTLTVGPTTGAGTIVGTPAYMSPEQATGGAVDARTDIWAFGCVMYEALTGRRAFDGATISETLAAVLAGSPDWTRLPAGTPMAARSLLRRCLARDPRQRPPNMAAVAFLLDEEAVLSNGPSAAQVPATSRSPWWPLGVGAALMAAVGIAAGYRWLWSQPADEPIVRTTIPAAMYTIGTDRNFAFVDGRRLWYVSEDGGQLLVRSLDALEPVPILTTPAFLRGIFPSPDGRWMGFVENNFTFRKIPAAGGAPITILTGDGPTRGASWGPDDTIVFATAALDTGLQQVSAAGGPVTVLTRPDASQNESDHAQPAFLPGGRGVLFTISAVKGAARIAVLDRSNGTWRTVIEGGNYAAYVHSGHLVYAAAGALWALRFDLSSLNVMGSPVEVVRKSDLGENPQFDVSPAGTLVYPRGVRNLSTDLRVPTWVDRTGRETPLPMPPANYLHPRISPDGRRLALVEGGDFFVWNLGQPESRGLRVTYAPGLDWFPVWTPDGRRIVFGSWRGGGFSNLYIQDPDTNTPERLTTSADMQLPTAISPDGSTVLFHVVPHDIRSFALEGRSETTLFESPLDERNAALSRDGRWLAYEGEAPGRPSELNVYVRPFPDAARRVWQVTSGGGTFPAWSRDGRELFYLKPDGTMVAVAIDATTTSWTLGRATDLFRGRYMIRDGSLGRQYDVAADGRFLMLKEQRNTDRAHFVVVQNWDQELTRLVPAR
jgi:serine/threonine-protein kinase